MSAAVNACHHDRPHDHAGHRHDHSHPHHGHSHAPHTPHPPSALSPSILRLSLAGRFGVAAAASAVLWGVVWLAMR